MNRRVNASLHISSLVSAFCAAAGTVQAADTSIGVNGVSEKSTMLKDVNGDGFVSDADLVIQLYDALGPDPEGDVDGDGSATAYDTVIAVEKTIATSCGDVDFSGSVDFSDVEDYIDALAGSEADFKYDVNLDGVVDSEDLVLIYSKIEVDGSVYTTPQAAVWLPARLIRARNEGIQAYWEAKKSPGHHVEISNSYRDHSQGTSNQWPDNHEFLVSGQWPDFTGHSWMDSMQMEPPRTHVRDSSSTWPANHRAAASTTWINTHDRELSYREKIHETETSNNHAVANSFQTYSHSQVTSASWERPHDEALSNLWTHAPGHMQVTSVTWDRKPDGTPQQHTVSTSYGWPPNHEGTDSRSDGTSVYPHEHIAAVSGTWIHNAQNSSTWPPMHDWLLSTTWVRGHQPANSLSWVPNHHGVVSSTWPERTNPGVWVPNRLQQQSLKDGSPLPPSRGPADWPLWPQDHNWFNSIKDVLPLIPDSAPNPF